MGPPTASPQGRSAPSMSWLRREVVESLGEVLTMGAPIAGGPEGCRDGVAHGTGPRFAKLRVSARSSDRRPVRTTPLPAPRRRRRRSRARAHVSERSACGTPPQARPVRARPSLETGVSLSTRRGGSVHPGWRCWQPGSSPPPIRVAPCTPVAPDSRRGQACAPGGRRVQLSAPAAGKRTRCRYTHTPPPWGCRAGVCAWRRRVQLSARAAGTCTGCRYAPTPPPGGSDVDRTRRPGSTAAPVRPSRLREARNR
jgi:hypothetical protein